MTTTIESPRFEFNAVRTHHDTVEDPSHEQFVIKPGQNTYASGDRVVLLVEDSQVEFMAEENNTILIVTCHNQPVRIQVGEEVEEGNDKMTTIAVSPADTHDIILIKREDIVGKRSLIIEDGVDLHYMRKITKRDAGGYEVTE